MVNIKILNKIKMKFLNLRSDSIGCWVPSLRFGKLRWDDKLVIANKFASRPSWFQRPNTTIEKDYSFYKLSFILFKRKIFSCDIFYIN